MDVISPRDLSDALGELALDLRWSWSHEADALWQRVNGEAWRRTQNPWTILQDISAERLQALATDRLFITELERLTRARQDYLDTPGWFAWGHGTAVLSGVAYFSMEFGLGEALPLYAGGLGILAGDFLRTASDLGLPAIGVGLLYQEGYFRQFIDASGAQQEAYPFQRPGLDADPASKRAGWGLAPHSPGHARARCPAARLPGTGRACRALSSRRQRSAQQPDRPGYHGQTLRRRDGDPPFAGNYSRRRGLARGRGTRPGG